MAQTIKLVAIGFFSYVVLDGMWLGWLMSTFYRQQLAPLARLSAEGGFAPIWSAAVPVYVLLGAGIAVFVAPRAASLGAAAGLGALFGLVVYGVYDLTNYSTLRQWPFAVVVADIAWGMAASAACGAVVWLGKR